MVLAEAARSTPELVVPPSSRTLNLKLASPAPLALVFFFNDTATTEIYTLSLHDALPIWVPSSLSELPAGRLREVTFTEARWLAGESLGSENPKSDRESTRVDSSH